MEKRKDNIRFAAAIATLSVFLAALMFFCIRELRPKCDTNNLYAPTMLSDSSFHVNLSDQSCMLVEITNGMMTIHTNNADMVGYDKTANKVFVFYHDMQHSFTIREYHIDSLLGTVPDTTIFDNH